MTVNKERAWESLQKIAFVRVTGTKEEKKAADLLQAAVEAEGIKAWQEPYELETVSVTKASLTVGGKEYPVMGIGGSGRTPKGGVKGRLIYMESNDDCYLTKVKDCICLVQERFNPKSAEKFKKAGAVGYIAMHGSLYDNEQLVRDPRPRDLRGKCPGLPGVSLHITLAEELIQQHLGEEAVMEVSFRTKKATSQNVVAVIEGTTIPDEEVLFSAHYDSVLYSKGPWDNGSGSILILELLRHYKDNPPMRTLRFVWCGSEEIGLVGSRKYCEAHKEDLGKVIYNLNFDMCGVSIGYNLFTCSANASALHQFEGFAKQKGWPIKCELGTASSDSTSFAEAGVPASYFGQLAPRGGSEFHNYRDTLERMDPDTFFASIQFALDYADTVISAAVNPIPREFDPEVTKKIESSKKMLQEITGEEEKKPEEKKPAKTGKAAEKKSVRK
ncbi:MAG: M28 family peptidase [Eubacteriaceae bacterium]|nr:M28 family peptidase [Eubacteriaceae bacterium]